ncbi:MAG TPA: DUF4440 domain-containing protein [Tepidisphaeraceae bacterium]|jgi:ketosteroid isomerase-like protein|nr:DUF4440 domain-containing protein [Tepidisphaeraceae bacterium]
MKNIYKCAALFIASLLLLSQAALAGDTPEQMIAGAKELDQRFCQAWSKGDLDGIMAAYWNSPDLVVYPADEMEQHGWAAVKESYKPFVADTHGAKLEMIDPHYMVAGDMVIGWGRWKLTLPGPDGKSVEVPGRYTSVMAKKDGKWVYIIDHPSVPMQAAGK